jgi:hypothetical protein
MSCYKVAYSIKFSDTENPELECMSMWGVAFVPWQARDLEARPSQGQLNFVCSGQADTLYLRHFPAPYSVFVETMSMPSTTGGDRQ